MKHKLKVGYYLRYCDDFVILNQNESYLKELVPKIANFLKNKLKLSPHERKIFIRKGRQGVDFLGYVTLPHYCVLRTKIKRRLFKKLLIKHN